MRNNKIKEEEPEILKESFENKNIIKTTMPQQIKKNLNKIKIK